MWVGGGWSSGGLRICCMNVDKEVDDGGFILIFSAIHSAAGVKKRVRDEEEEEEEE